MNERELEARLEQLERVRTWSPRVVSKMEALLRTDDDAKLFRINAVAFAMERGVDEKEAIDLFLHATKLGLFSMEWRLICPQCTDAVETFHTLGSIRSTYHCTLCRTDLETSLDDFIEVSFTVSASLRKLTLHDPDSLAIDDFCFKYHGSTATGPDGRPWQDEWRRRIRAEAGRFVPEPDELPAGRGVIEIENAMSRRAAIVAINPGPHGRPPQTILPRFLTGKQLFVTPAFADLFRAETIVRHGGLALRDLTFLFTDLKGSTELYDRIGDLRAFHLVDQHFEHLAGVVRRHDGVLVKTIGDAVMAAFASAEKATASAVEMLGTIERFNRERGGRDIVLKIGMHRGPAIAVTLNDRLDYFGQTINIAARTQALADGDEICLTDAVLESPGVSALLSDVELTSRETRLRGIERPLRIHRVRAS
jgi:class 3 adenylate cyclase